MKLKAREIVVKRLLRPAVSAAFGLPGLTRRTLTGPRIHADGQTLDPHTQCLLRLMSLVKTPLPDTTPEALKASRDHVREGMQLLAGRSIDVWSKDVAIQGAETQLPCRLYVPPRAGDELLLYFHGGGWALGDLDSHDALCRLLAVKAGIKVLLVSYRKAPEHPWPAAMLDADQVYREVVQRHLEFGVSSRRIVLGGDSAGANLATILARRLVATDLPPPLAQLLIYPITDCVGGQRSRELFAEGFVLTGQLIERFLDLYIPAGMDRYHPDLSPLHAPDLAGLPPTLLVTAGFDPLRDEGEAYGEQLQEAGVHVCMMCQDGLVHGFANMLSIPTARRATSDIARELMSLLESLDKGDFFSAARSPASAAAR